ncbi:MAG: shikimate kinase [bacterium]|nr:shikimate kinase [bacterium]
MKTENNTKNIVLTGMPGAGKTSVAKELSKHFANFNVCETDLMIENLEKRTITEIFTQDGEEYFRKVEKDLIEKISKNNKQICSLGGGSFINEENITNLQKNSIIFYLKTDINTIYERIKNETQRPLLKTTNPKNTLNDLLTKREKQYNKADVIIDTTNKTLEEIAQEIIKEYKKL